MREWEGEGGRGREGGVYCSSLVLRPCPSVHSASTDIYTHMHTVYRTFLHKAIKPRLTIFVMKNCGRHSRLSKNWMVSRELKP